MEEIGRGGMGTVWWAQDEAAGREVAVKEVHLSPSLDQRERDNLVRRTHREAMAAGRLHHRNLIAMYDVVVEDGRPWLIMEYVPARSLEDVFVDDGPISPPRVADIGTQLLAALGVAHAAGIVHRDVKPSNVLLEPSGRAVLTDFGIATYDGATTLTQSGTFMGSPAYVAPEVAKGERATPASDLWSLGATLYAAVEGRPPYDHDTAMATLSALVTVEPDPPVRAGPLRPVLEGLLRKDPARRLAADRAAALLAEAAAADPPAQPSGERPGRRLARRTGRHPATPGGSRHDVPPGFRQGAAPRPHAGPVPPIPPHRPPSASSGPVAPHPPSAASAGPAASHRGDAASSGPAAPHPPNAAPAERGSPHRPSASRPGPAALRLPSAGSSGPAAPSAPLARSDGPDRVTPGRRFLDRKGVLPAVSGGVLALAVAAGVMTGLHGWVRPRPGVADNRPSLASGRPTTSATAVPPPTAASSSAAGPDLALPGRLRDPSGRPASRKVAERGGAWPETTTVTLTVPGRVRRIGVLVVCRARVGTLSFTASPVGSARTVRGACVPPGHGDGAAATLRLPAGVPHARIRVRVRPGPHAAGSGPVAWLAGVYEALTT